MTGREKAILKRNIFLGVCALILALAVVLVIFIISAVTKDDDNRTETSSLDMISSEIPQTEIVSSEEPSLSEVTSSKEEETPHGLDAEFTNLLLVSAQNPLPEDYDYDGNLVTIPNKYLKGFRNKFNKKAWPYLKAMIDDARSEGVDIGVLSPYRSYEVQKQLFQQQITKQINNGVPESEAEEKAATVVTRPGTSEHHTGLSLDINCADESFEQMDAYDWLMKNAENYGFVMRYPKDKQDVTGIIYESWHWRFVGINAAREINDLDMCLEEYVEYKK